MSRKVLVHGAVLAALLALSGGAAAQLYQWRDTNGKMVFSDIPPPPGIPAGNIIKAPKGRSAPAPAAATSAAAPAGSAASASPSPGQKSIAEREAEYKKRQADAAEKAAKEEASANEERLKQGRCREIRSGLAQMESGQRIRTVDEKGEPAFLDDGERAKRTEQLRRDLASAKCG